MLRNLIRVLGPDAACRALRNVGQVIERGGYLFIVGHVLQDSRLAPAEAVYLNLAFLSVYEDGAAATAGASVAPGWRKPASPTSTCATAPAPAEQALLVRARARA